MVASALVCLALTVYMESRGEPVHGQVAVASVVLNRVSNNDSDICTEIVRPSQFPWAKSKLRRTPSGDVVVASDLPSDSQWGSALRLAHAVLTGEKTRVPRVTHFHATWVEPRWQLPYAFTIGRHIFYHGEAPGIRDPLPVRYSPPALRGSLARFAAFGPSLPAWLYGTTTHGIASTTPVFPFWG